MTIQGKIDIARIKVKTSQEILKKVIKDKQYLQSLIAEIEIREQVMRDEYHIALTEYDNLTINRRRHFR